MKMWHRLPPSLPNLLPKFSVPMSLTSCYWLFLCRQVLPVINPLILSLCSEYAMLKSSWKIKSMGTEDIQLSITELIFLVQEFFCISYKNASKLTGWIARKIFLICSGTWISFTRFKDSQVKQFDFTSTYVFLLHVRKKYRVTSHNPSKSEIRSFAKFW